MLLSVLIYPFAGVGNEVYFRDDSSVLVICSTSSVISISFMSNDNRLHLLLYMDMMLFNSSKMDLIFDFKPLGYIFFRNIYGSGNPFKLPIVCDSYLNVVSAIYSFPIFKYFIFECCHNRVCMLKLC